VTAAVLFEDFPQAALAVLVGGLALRWLLVARRPVIGAGDLPIPDWRRFGRVGALALVLVLLAHLVALVAPQALVAVSRARLRLYLLEGSGFLVGLAATLAWGRAVLRHLRAEGPSLAGLADSTLLALVAVALVSGLVTAVLYRWASLWGVATLTPYVRSLGRAQPLGQLAAPMPFSVRVHLVSTFAALAVFPASRLAPAVIAPLHRLAGLVLSWLARPVKAAARHTRPWLARHNPAAWLWPEEE
jgi:nitrate reductase gamma subunit